MQIDLDFQSSNLSKPINSYIQSVNSQSTTSGTAKPRAELNVQPTQIPEILIMEPQVFCDHRGFFFESHNQKDFLKKTGIDAQFVQDNHSYSIKGTLRGLHYQIQQPQGKLVRVIMGTIFDVAVDIRRRSPTFKQWLGTTLSAENKRQIWIPPGFAHGFLVLSDGAEVLYKSTDYYASRHERCIIWNDPDLKIAWPLKSFSPILSEKDKAGLPLAAAHVY